MPVSLPTSADVRRARSQASKAVNSQLDLVRTPFLAWLGAGDLALHKVNDAVARARSQANQRGEAARVRAEKLQEQLAELPTEVRDRFTADELRKRYDDATGEARKRYTELADRGESTLARIRRQPNVAKLISSVEDAGGRAGQRLERVVDDVHDAGEDVLGRVSTETRSVGERAARTTQRHSDEAAGTVTRLGGEVAEEVRDAGDEAAHVTRSATRKAANRTTPRRAPAKPRNSGNAGTNGTAR